MQSARSGSAPLRSLERTHLVVLNPGRESIRLAFQRVTKKHSDSQELHFDVAVDDLQEAEMIVRQNGGSHVKTSRTSSGFEWRVLKDLQGNSFCIYKDSEH